MCENTPLVLFLVCIEFPNKFRMKITGEQYALTYNTDTTGDKPF